MAQVPAIVPLGVFVDGLFYHGPPEAHEALKKLAATEAYEHDADCKVYKFRRCSWQHVPHSEQGTSHNKPSFKPPLRHVWDEDTCERDIEQRISTKGLEQVALDQKARWNKLIEGKAQPLSDTSYFIVASAIGHEGMLCVGPAGCGKSVLLK